MPKKKYEIKNKPARKEAWRLKKGGIEYGFRYIQKNKRDIMKGDFNALIPLITLMSTPHLDKKGVSVELLGVIKEKDPELSDVIVEALVSFLPEQDAETRSYVGEILGEARGNSEEFVRDLVNEMWNNFELLKSRGEENWFIVNHIIEIIGVIGSRNPCMVSHLVPMLIKNLEEDESASFFWLLPKALSDIGMGNPDLIKDAAPTLKQLLREEKGVTPFIVSALGYIGAKYPERIADAVPKIIELLEKSREADRVLILEALAKVASKNPGLVKDAIPKLQEMLNSQDAHVRSGAIIVLSSIGGKDPELIKETIPFLRKTLHDFPEDSTYISADMAANHPDLAREIAPLLMKLLSEADEKNRGWIAGALGEIGSVYPDIVTEAIPQIMEMLDDPSEENKAWAADAIGSIGMKDPKLVIDAVPSLISLLKSTDRGVVAWSAYALGNICQDAPSLIENGLPTLIQKINDPDELVRGLTAEALGKIGHLSALDPLKKLLEKEKDDRVIGVKDDWLYLKDIIEKAIDRIELKHVHMETG